MEKVTLLHNGKYLNKENGSKMLKDLGFVENDLILMQEGKEKEKENVKKIKESDIDIM